MPFQSAPRRAACITCRKPIERGDRCYLGERTGMTWCPGCAASGLQKTDTETPETPRGSVLPAGWGRFKPPVVKTFGERD